MSTPMQQQYERLKKKHEDCILLFRLGDFYECFDNDAKIISKVLNIVLTSRGQGTNKRPMAGIPHHALENYLHKLVNAGYKVAIAEQLEEPQKGKTVVDRDVVKIITSGTITSEKSLDRDKNNYIACVSTLLTKNVTTWGLSICDLTTGEFYITEFYAKTSESTLEVIEDIKRINPAEIIVSKENLVYFRRELSQSRIQEAEEFEFNYSDNKDRLLRHFKVKNLKGFGIDKYKAGIIAAGIVLNYLSETQKTSLSHITKIYYKKITDFMMLDKATIRSLELISTIRNDSSATLLKILDKCQTPMGKRKLFNWIISPLINAVDIQARLDSVEELYKNSIVLDEIRNILDNIYDIERILGKIGTETINARDLLALRQSLESTNSLLQITKKHRTPLLKAVFKSLSSLGVSNKVIQLISDAIVDDPPVTITEGSIIKKGYNKELDKILNASSSGKEWLSELEASEKKRTKIQSLKVKYNRVFGYYIEVSKANFDKVPNDYIRKQTLVNAERFITPELKEKEDLILNAEENAINLEYELFVKIREDISEHIKTLQEIAEAVAVLDCLANFAKIARLNDFSKPQLVDNHKSILKIIEGRHPVVEQIQNEEFIPNDTTLDCKESQVAIITGPNMAGKSTYIRQVALIVLLAQIGSYVPATKMQFRPVDRIFTRVGASDNLAAGESTFLIEMNETANILNNATKDSLIILDEVGRGTSTYDGVAIAWAVAEYIHNKVGAKTLFATHYHELVDLSKYLHKVKNYNFTVKEYNGKIIFLRKLKQGGTDKSYGVHVAEFSGIPGEVIKKAEEILMSLEQEGMFEVKHIESEITQKKSSVPRQMTLLTKLPEDPTVKELKKLDTNKMTPLEALKKLDELIGSVKGKAKSMTYRE
ncbi:DNA mismatch repair protein MutS [Candidatus Dojkabacteria bacterium]|nr:DNA mismatch repair protein MutS [Candidatus Dojkabacteria bacterium]